MFRKFLRNQRRFSHVRQGFDGNVAGLVVGAEKLKNFQKALDRVARVWYNTLVNEAERLRSHPAATASSG